MPDDTPVNRYNKWRSDLGAFLTEQINPRRDEILLEMYGPFNRDLLPDRECSVAQDDFSGDGEDVITVCFVNGIEVDYDVYRQCIKAAKQEVIRAKGNARIVAKNAPSKDRLEQLFGGKPKQIADYPTAQDEDAEPKKRKAVAPRQSANQKADAELEDA